MVIKRINSILLLFFTLSILLAACSNPLQKKEEHSTTLSSSPTAQSEATLDASSNTVMTPTMTEDFVPLEPIATQPWPTPWPTPDHPLTKEERALLFDELWQIVNERYIDPDFNGVNWEAERVYRRPRAINAPDNEIYYQELKEMVWALNDQHSGFMTPEEVLEMLALTANEVEYSGFGLYAMPLEDGSALVLQVHKGSSAEQAGIQACDRILSIDGLYFQYEDDEGPPGSTATLVFERPNGESFSQTLQRSELIKVLHMPSEVLPEHSKRIGYIRLDLDILWVFESPEQFREQLAQLEADGALDGLIIDLRTNQGGWREALQGIAGIFVEGTLGEFYGRLQNHLFIAPRSYDPLPTHPDLPLVLLVSQYTKSYGEILAASLQAERNAIVIGQQTAGNVESLYPYDLPFSARVWIAEQGFRLNSGDILDNIGVIPNLIDDTEWMDYPCGRDPQIERAATLLEEWAVNGSISIPSSSTSDGPQTTEERALLFDNLWQLINERYIDPDFNGLDWEAERANRRPRLLETTDNETFYQELKEMVGALNDQHSEFMTPEEVLEQDAQTRNEFEYEGFGLYIMPLEDGALVLQVYEGTPAAEAGIQACDRLLTLDGQLYEYDEGPPSSTVTLKIERPNGETRSLTLKREEVTQVLDIPAEILPDGKKRIGYVRLDTLWVYDMPKQFRAKLAELEADGPLEGLILDLRTNQGGWRDVLQDVLGSFVTGQLGEFSGRLQSDPLITPRLNDPPPDYLDLPLVVLVGSYTSGYAEILAATLQAERDATIIGQPTPGNVETVFPYDLPFGARIWIAEQEFRLNNGDLLEGAGIKPDLIDDTDWTRYPCGRDPQIQKAADLLEKR